MSFSRVDSWVMEQTGAADSSALLAYQIDRARETVRYASERGAFYRERLKNADFNFEDITKLPFTFPEDIEKYSAEMLCVSQGSVSRVVTHVTSGTTARPKRIFFTQNDQNATVDFFRHGMSEFTSEGDTVLILFPSAKEGSIGQLLAEGLKRLGAVPLIYGIVRDYNDLFDFIAGKMINVVVGLPQQLLELSRLCRLRKIAVCGIHSVLLSADYVAKSVVRAIEENLGCLVYEHYGLTETCFGGGVFSKARDGYHLRHGDFLFEIVEPKTGAALPRGEYGEVVFTSLKTGAMPLIRYKTGDISRLVYRGLKYPVLDRIKGRVKGGIQLANGKTLHMTELEEALFVHQNVLDFRAIYIDGALKIYVRSLRFNRNRIIGTLLNSPVENILGGVTVNVFPLNASHVCDNTMAKRSIITSGR